ncbi:MAG: glycoside hydrolase family 127 protein, partial [Clostridiales bacterium]|nr:glycoside hydrolase family 127 protein [Clostridiales bacterium]
AGVGLIPLVAAQRAHDGIYLSFYLPGSTGCLTPGGQNAVFEISGEYPLGSSVSIKIRLDRPEEMTLAFRIPKWSKRTVMSLNGEYISAVPGWKSIGRLWHDGDTVRLDLDMSVYLIQPPDTQARGRYVALRRGAIVLAADARLGFDEKKTLRIPADVDGRVKARKAECPEIPDCNLCVEIETADGPVRLIDYSSAGKTYDDSSRFAAWLPIGS